MTGITGLERPDAEDEAAKSYGVLLSDTVVVGAGGAAPDVATASAPKDWSEVAYYLEDQVRDKWGSGHQNECSVLHQR